MCIRDRVCSGLLRGLPRGVTATPDPLPKTPPARAGGAFCGAGGRGGGGPPKKAAQQTAANR
eukprot:2419720-Alexandrium_andersonii.AAC.1